MTRTHSSLIVAAGVLGLALCVVWLGGQGGRPERAVSAKPAIEPTPRAEVETPPGARAEAQVEAPLEHSDKGVADPDRERSERMRGEIQRALAQRSPAGSGLSGAAGPAAQGPIEASELSEHNQKYLREQVKADLLPPVLDCYSSALAIDPTLSGTLALEFAVIGDPEIGGVVEYAEVDTEQSTLVSEFMAECVRESTMAMSFDAPPEGGRFALHYPLVFEPDDD